MGNSQNITWHHSTISKNDRQILNQHKSCVLWFTGLSGSGKSTLANAVDSALYHEGVQSYVLDGDNIRHGLNKDLRFSPEDRTENIRRIGEVAKLFVESGQIVSTAFISPFLEDRAIVREMFAPGEFIEIYVHCPIQVCENRDPKGLYKKARNGEIPEFTGISSPYEAPKNPEILIDTDKMTIGESVEKIIRFLKDKKIL
ncbi:adenylyl-sulfate kinase [Neobacillus sp. K501]